MKPYGLAADLHLFNWSAFSAVNERGVNTRLAALLGELKRLAKEVLAAGGNRIYIAGDTFHVRGSIAPSVLNPTLDTFVEIKDMGVEVVVIPGNHDLEGKNSTRLGSAVTALEGAGCIVVEQNTMFDGDHDQIRVFAVPWCESIVTLKETLERVASRYERADETDVILHAPIDGVLTGLPCHGLDPEWLGNLGFRSVYAGHYHHHKEFDHCIYSVGALAHHTWSDVNSKAGFLLVGSTGPKWFKSHLPEFVDLNETNIEDGPLLAEGNYVRVKIDGALKMSEIESARQEVMDWGAKGVVVQSIKVAKVSREGSKDVTASVSAGASLESSISEYVKAQSFPDPEKINIECQRVLAEAGV